MAETLPIRLKTLFNQSTKPPPLHYEQLQDKLQYNELSRTQPRQQHPADRLHRYNGSSTNRTFKCSCIVNYNGHECSICFRSKQVEYICFNRTESSIFKPKQINL